MNSVSEFNAFSPDYATARARFREAASRRGWQLEAHPVGGSGPAGEELTVDVAWTGGDDADKALVVSSGVHGVEGFLGSAVQLGWLKQHRSQAPQGWRYVFLHGINPYGFAWLRRFDENNVDLNRNFLLPEEPYTGAPAGYAELDSLLNPPRPPSLWEPFALKALWAIAKQGMPMLQQAVASGQYEYPRGLFFGGCRPSRVQQILDSGLRRWLQGVRQAVHLDFHSGLGKWGTSKLLIDHPLSESQRARLTDWFGPDALDTCNDNGNGVGYHARGGFGRWCVAQDFVPDYLFACAEFGTYHPIQVVSGLRAENQSHHWGTASAASTIRGKDRLKELFCPSNRTWRSRTLDRGLDLIAQAGGG